MLEYTVNCIYTDKKEVFIITYEEYKNAIDFCDSEDLFDLLIKKHPFFADQYANELIAEIKTTPRKYSYENAEKQYQLLLNKISNTI